MTETEKHSNSSAEFLNRLENEFKKAFGDGTNLSNSEYETYKDTFSDFLMEASFGDIKDIGEFIAEYKPKLKRIDNEGQ